LICIKLTDLIIGLVSVYDYRSRGEHGI